jgi:SpoVK/Ycf46/Vps4 family AAA+-type ATPase
LLSCGVLQEAVKMVQPSLRREGFSSIPNVKWEDVGGLDFLRKEFDRYIVRRIKVPEDYEVFCNYSPFSHLIVCVWFVCMHACGVCACVKEIFH